MTIEAAIAALLLAAPTSCRVVNTRDHITFVGAAPQKLDDGLEDFAEIYADGEDVDTSYDPLEDFIP